MAEDVRCVLQAGATTGECPIWSEAEARLYWVDVQEPALHRFDPATGQDEHWELPAWVGCYALGEDWCALVALRTGLAWLDLGSGALAPAANLPCDPRRFFANDGRADPQGRFWVGPMHEPYKDIHGGPERAPLWRFDPATGEVAAMTDPVGTSNGLAWSPDGETMYHSDTSQKLIWAYRFHGDEGRLSGKRVFAEVQAPEKGSGPDGGCVDAEGYYWAAIFGGARLIRYDPTGRIERQVEMPVKNPTMCAFGGPDGRTAFVTSANKPLSPEERRAHPLAGALLSFKAPAPGLPAHRVRRASAQVTSAAA